MLAWEKIPASASRFDGVAENYAWYRPSYPITAIKALLDGLPIEPDVVDVGAGTGIASRLFADAGASVIAIEPSEEMRAYARNAGLDARAGTASETGLPNCSADLVTAFQAFHWFANERTMTEFRRILRPHGRFAAAWNERDPEDPLGRDLIELDRAHGEQKMIEKFDYPKDGTESFLRRSGFANVRPMRFPNVQRLDEEHIVGRQRSLSFAPRSGPELDAYIAKTLELFDRHRAKALLISVCVARKETIVLLKFFGNITVGWIAFDRHDVMNVLHAIGTKARFGTAFYDVVPVALRPPLTFTDRFNEQTDIMGLLCFPTGKAAYSARVILFAALSSRP